MHLLKTSLQPASS